MGVANSFGAPCTEGIRYSHVCAFTRIAPILFGALGTEGVPYSCVYGFTQNGSNEFPWNSGRKKSQPFLLLWIRKKWNTEHRWRAQREFVIGIFGREDPSKRSQADFPKQKIPSGRFQSRDPKPKIPSGTFQAKLLDKSWLGSRW
jgi:hypothetical protein